MKDEKQKFEVSFEDAAAVRKFLVRRAMQKGGCRRASEIAPHVSALSASALAEFVAPRLKRGADLPYASRAYAKIFESVLSQALEKFTGAIRNERAKDPGATAGFMTEKNGDSTESEGEKNG